MIIRVGTVEDAAGMAAVSCAAWKWAYGEFLDPEFLQRRTVEVDRAARIREYWNADHLHLVAEDAGRVVGFATEHLPCSLAGFDAEVGALYVHPDAARMGVGRALLCALVTHFMAQGARSMAIHTLTQGVIGCAFYEKMGGVRGPEDTWNGYPAIWFVWRDLSGLLGPSSSPPSNFQSG